MKEWAPVFGLLGCICSLWSQFQVDPWAAHYARVGCGLLFAAYVFKETK